MKNGKKNRKEANYLVFTLKPPAPPKAPAPTSIPPAPAKPASN